MHREGSPNGTYIDHHAYRSDQGTPDGVRGGCVLVPLRQTKVRRKTIIPSIAVWACHSEANPRARGVKQVLACDARISCKCVYLQ